MLYVLPPVQSLKGESMHTWGREVNNGEERDLCSDAFHSRVEALGGQAQEEATDEPAGQDDVPFYKVCSLCRRREKKQYESIKASYCILPVKSVCWKNRE